ncbi:tetratricopeptide repeat-containing sensor histidine kinase [Actomonas aquatica]|uniref:Histidine kinase n=1 Tax=Actomonas aquatica TaxID=2866162 RepID=A0ABZ1CEZ6_9BACT|nr:histidine kinase [Opitutus sp. WL0086]WRQ89872.1 histidine kinase [Opitutus sp. WL0086]
MPRRILLALTLLLSPAALLPQVPPSPSTSDYETAFARLLDPDIVIAPAIEQVTQLRMARDGTTAIDARIAVDLDLADHLIAADRPLDAAAHLSHALELARPLRDADQLLEIYTRRAHCFDTARDRASAIDSAQRGFDIARQLNRPAPQIDLGCLLARLLFENGDTATAIALLAFLDELPDNNGVAIALSRARLLNTNGGSHANTQRWQTVADRARAAADIPTLALAHDQLGRLSYLEGDLPAAQSHFATADQLAPDRDRSSWVWETHGRTMSRLGQAEEAIMALEQALTDTNDSHAADLHEAVARLQLDQQNLPAARHHYEAALELRKAGVISQRVPNVRMAPMVSHQQSDDAADLAAVRAALREAELERTQLRQRQTLGITTVVTLVAALLGLAYAYKRRAAANAVLARDTAELRAENAQLIALRYQLNPHFLFNALNSLRARVFSNQSEAERLIDRLTAFCRRTLEHRDDGIETVGDECDLLEAFLQIEQSRWRENLTVTLDFDPAARARRIPTFLLLPLVENALKYGAQTSEEHIVIEVSIQAPDDDMLVITVSNSGSWIEPGTARRQTSTRTGVTNVRERLARYYPDRHTFTVGPSPTGVTATLTVTGSPQTKL